MKNLPANAGDTGSIPGLGRAPGGGNGKPTPAFLPGESQGQRSLWSYSPWGCERLLLNHANTPGFLAPGGEEFNPGPETRLDRSELLCNKILLKYKGDRESF